MLNDSFVFDSDTPKLRRPMLCLLRGPSSNLPIYWDHSEKLNWSWMRLMLHPHVNKLGLVHQYWQHLTEKSKNLAHFKSSLEIEDTIHSHFRLVNFHYWAQVHSSKMIVVFDFSSML